MAKHLPTTVWGFWRERKTTGNWKNGHVRTFDSRQIEIALFPQDGKLLFDELDPGQGVGLRFTRVEAKMLAKRIVQCLEGTT